MNLLPFILSVIILISLATATLLRSQSLHESRALRGRFQAEWNHRTIAARDKFRAVKAKSSAAPTSSTTTSKTTFERYMTCRTESAKLNITRLLDKRDQFLYEPAAALLRILYADKPFWKPKMEYMILEALTDHRDKPLWEQEPHDLFYQIVQGTNTYDLEKKRGIPPLLDYFILDDKSGKSPLFSDASLPMLEAFFGAAVAGEIYLQEQKEGKALKQEQLLELLTRRRGSFDPNTLSSAFKFSDEKSPTAVLMHRKTGATARR